MTDFILIIPAGWTQLDWEFIVANGIMDASYANNAIVCHLLADMETMLKDNGLIPVENSMVEAKLIDNTFFMVRLE